MNPFDVMKSIRATLDQTPWIRPALFFVGLAAYIASQATPETSTLHKVAESALKALIALAAGSFGAPSPIAVAASVAKANGSTPSPITEVKP